MEYSLPFKPKVDSYFLGIEAFESEKLRLSAYNESGDLMKEIRFRIHAKRQFEFNVFHNKTHTSPLLYHLHFHPSVFLPSFFGCIGCYWHGLSIAFGG